MSNARAHERWWWNASDDRYFDFAEAMPSAGTLPLIALSGARSEVDEAGAAAHVVTVDQVLAGLLPELRAAFERMKARCHGDRGATRARARSGWRGAREHDRQRDRG